MIICVTILYGFGERLFLWEHMNDNFLNPNEDII